MAYSYQSAPQPVAGSSTTTLTTTQPQTNLLRTTLQRPKYRPQQQPHSNDHLTYNTILQTTVQQLQNDEPTENIKYYANIMYDKRVVRGPTVKGQTLQLHLTQPAATKPKQQNDQSLPPTQRRYHPSTKAERQRMYGIKVDDEEEEEKTATSNTQRWHEGIQTDVSSSHSGQPLINYLDDLDGELDQQYADIYTTTHTTQTDAYMADPVTAPVFATRVLGVDAVTQVEVGELFDFEKEVEHVLEVVVGRALSEGQIEVNEEEERRRLNADREHWRYERHQIVVETQRLEAQTKRHYAERAARRQEAEAKRREQVKQADERAAALAAQQLLNDINDSVIASLHEAGHFPDLLQQEIQQHFMPWLQSAIEQQMKQHEISKQVVDTLIHGAIQQITEQQIQALKLQQQQETAAEEQFQQQVAQHFEQLQLQQAEKDSDRERNYEKELAAEAAEAERLQQQTQRRAARQARRDAEEEDVSDDSDEDGVADAE